MFPADELEKKQDEFLSLIVSGRLPISRSNVSLIPVDSETNPKEIISARSIDADLTIVGFRNELIKAEGINIFTGYENIGNVLFVSSRAEKNIT